MKLNFNAQHWIDAWDADPDTSLKQMKKAGLGSYTSPGFDDWARRFDAQSFTESGKARAARIMAWVEQHIGTFDQTSVLDVGAASGVFSMPFAQQGAHVTALEPAPILQTLLRNHAQEQNLDIEIYPEAFENINTQNMPTYDLVFASMCPAFIDWPAVEKAIALAKHYLYISLMAGPKTNRFVETLLPIIEREGNNDVADMYYLMQILYCKDYTYDLRIEQHEKTETFTKDEIMTYLDTWFMDYKITLTDDDKAKIMTYIDTHYDTHVDVTTGGKFGKLLIYTSA